MDDRYTAPDATSDDLAITCDGHVVEIKAVTANDRRRKRVELPHPVDPDSGRASFTNQILELKFTKGDPDGDAATIDIT